MRLLRQLGRGATSEAWLARSRFRTRVVKRLHPELAQDARMVARLEHEARLASRLRHRNLARVHGARDGALIMEYVDGCDLRALLRRLESPVPGLGAYVVAEVCRGLAYLHVRGLVHRDVSPANIFISRKGEVKLGDFGLLRDEEGLDTRTGSLRGNLAYMSPEQLDGKSVDGRADVFACGVVLHECTRLRRLWKALDPAAMRAARKEPIPPLDDPALEALCGRALAQELTAAELAGALKSDFSRAQLAALVPPPPSEPSRITRTQAPPRRRRYLLVALAAVPIAAALAWPSKKPAPVIAAAPAPERQIIVVDGPKPQPAPPVRHATPPKPKAGLAEGKLLDPFRK
jgi:eukaryotic-like serine/threonine-protein kinase